MKYSEALLWVKNLNSQDPDADVELKTEAIRKILSMETLNAVTKDDLRRCAEWLLKQIEWVDVKDRLPQKGKPVLVYIPSPCEPMVKGEIQLEYEAESGKGKPVWMIGQGTSLHLAEKDIPTHWIKYPAPPKEDK